MNAAAGSGDHDTYMSTLWFSLEANRSMSGTPHKAEIFSNETDSKLHSLFPLSPLERLSATMFETPGMWLAVIQIFLDKAQFQISFATASHSIDFEPPILLT